MEHADPLGIVSEGLKDVAIGSAEALHARIEELVAADAPCEAGTLRAAQGDAEQALEDLRTAQPLFWDDALVMRYASLAPLDRLRQDPRFDVIVRELDRSWGM